MNPNIWQTAPEPTTPEERIADLEAKTQAHEAAVVAAINATEAGMAFSTAEQTLPKAVCVLIRNDDDKILAVSRRGRPQDMNLPGGKVDAGESLEAACIREVYEETGYFIGSLEPIFTDLCHGEATYEVTTFQAKIVSRPGLSEPDLYVDWIDDDDLLQPENAFVIYNRKLLVPRTVCL